MEHKEIAALAQAIKANMAQLLIGKDHELQLVLVGLFAGGPVLLDDVPGTGKTVLAKSLARSVDCQFARIQFTADLLPSDITGLNVYNQKAGEFVFQPGPAFTNILLADEINRATPRTQSALLECMEEKQITVDGVTKPLERPFFVIATQNPVETAGTFALPEAQLDRFLLRLSLGYPRHEESATVLTNYLAGRGSNEMVLEPVATGMQIAEAQAAVGQIRGMLSMLRCCQALAAIEGRAYVLPDDVKQLAGPVFAHRLILNSRYGSSQKSAELIEQLLSSVPAPTEDPNAKLPTA